MLTTKESNQVAYYEESARYDIKCMKRIISCIENPLCDMSMSEFSTEMRRALSAYDYDREKLEAIYNADYKRTFLDDEDEA